MIPGLIGVFSLPNVLAIENGPVEIVSFPFKKMTIFHSFLLIKPYIILAPQNPWEFRSQRSGLGPLGPQTSTGSAGPSPDIQEIQWPGNRNCRKVPYMESM